MLLMLLYVVSLYYIYIYIIKYREKTKASRRKGRENQGEGCRRHLRPFLASLLFRLMSSPSNHRQPLTTRPLVSALRERDGRPPRPLLGDVIATPRHHIASEQQPQGIASTFCHPPRLFLVLVLFLQVVREGQRASQGGPPLPAHPVYPLHPAGVPRHICGHPRR